MYKRQPQDLGRIGVLTAPGGAPYVVLDDEPCALEVSLTDRAGHAVCLVGPEGSSRSVGGLGVDVEIVEERSQDFVRDFLTGREQRWLTGQLVGSPDAYAAGANLVSVSYTQDVYKRQLSTTARSTRSRVFASCARERSGARPGRWSVTEGEYTTSTLPNSTDG